MKKHFAFAAAAIAAVAAMAPVQAATVNFDQSTDTAFYTSQGLVLNGFTILDNTFGNAVVVPSSPNYANVNATGSSISFVDASGRATTSNGFGLTIPGLNNGGGYYAGGTLSFLSSTGALLGTQSFASVGPNESRSAINYSNGFAGIASVVFTRFENPNGPALFPIDDVTFSLNAVAVPEPASWALMIAGVGMAGGAMRRRRAKVSVRFA